MAHETDSGGNRDLPKLTTFRGWLRSHRQDELNVWGEAALKLAFPLFMVEWTEQKLTHVAENLHPLCKTLVLQTRQYRRFAGYNLERGSYYSLIRDDTGNDFGTLAAELNAYRDRADQDIYVEVFDKLSPSILGQIAGSPKFREAIESCVIVAMFPASRLRLAVEQYGVIGQGRMSDPNLASHLTENRLVYLMLLPIVAKHEIQRVVDLRDPETRETFYQIFAVGRIGKAEPSYYRPLGKNISSFIGMVPELIDPHPGGATGGQGGPLQAIGDYLRGKAVAGLVYPSARTDSYVEFKNGEMSDFGGWNFVDFRNSPQEAWPVNGYTHIIDPWQETVLEGVGVQNASSGPFAGSLKIFGVRNANDEFYVSSSDDRRRHLQAKANNRPEIILLRGSTTLDRLAGGA
jgi:hypothetical protein